MSFSYQSLLGVTDVEADSISTKFLKAGDIAVDNDINVSGNLNELGISTLATTNITGPLSITTGAADSYILTSDLHGNATWQPPAIAILSGDVSGPTNMNTVNNVGGSTAALIHSAELLANGASNANIPNSIVRRDAYGYFTAGTISANLYGNASTSTLASNVITNANMYGDVSSIGNSTTVLTVGGSTASLVHSGEVLANAATNTNTANTIVKRDGSGNFSAGTITANLTGTASDVLNASVISKVLTGFTGTTGTIAASDTILQAIQKLSGNTKAIGATGATGATGPQGPQGVQGVTGSVGSLNGDCTGAAGSNVVNTLRGGTVTIPTGTDTVATLAATQTLTNKTLTSCGSISASGTISTTANILANTVNCAYVSATSNITGASLNTGSGQISGGAITCTSLNTGSGNISSNNITAASNLTGAHISTSGGISASNSIQAGNNTWGAPSAGVGGQGTWLGWNRNNGSGRAAIICQQGGGAGGFEFLNYDNNGNITNGGNALMTLDSSANLVIGGNVQSYGSITISNNIQCGGSITTTNNIFGSGHFTAPTVQGGYIGWNRGVGLSGATAFINQEGGGSGAWEWINYNSSNALTSPNPSMILTKAGDLSIAGNLTVSGTVTNTLTFFTMQYRLMTEYIYASVPTWQYSVMMSNQPSVASYDIKSYTYSSFVSPYNCNYFVSWSVPYDFVGTPTTPIWFGARARTGNTVTAISQLFMQGSTTGCGSSVLGGVNAGDTVEFVAYATSTIQTITAGSSGGSAVTGSCTFHKI